MSEDVSVSSCCLGLPLMLQITFVVSFLGVVT